MGLLSASLGGSTLPSTPSQSQTTYATSEFPEEMKPFISDLLEKAQSQFNTRSETGYDPYGGARVAEFDPTQEEGFTGLESLARSGLSSRSDLTSAGQYYDQSLGLLDKASSAITGDDINRLANPYQQQVTDITKREAQRNFEQNTMPRMDAEATAAGAFGGSRAGLLASENYRNLGTRLDDIQMKGSQAGYNEAMRAAEAEKARFGSGAAAYQGLAGAIPAQAERELGILGQVGSERRTQTQQALDAAYGDFLEEQEFDTRNLQEYASTVHGTPFQPSTYRATQDYKPTPSIFEQLLQGAGTAAGIYGAYGGFNNNKTDNKTGGQIKKYASGGQVKRYAGGGLISLASGRQPDIRQRVREPIRVVNGIPVAPLAGSPLPKGVVPRTRNQIVRTHTPVVDYPIDGVDIKKDSRLPLGMHDPMAAATLALSNSRDNRRDFLESDGSPEAIAARMAASKARISAGLDKDKAVQQEIIDRNPWMLLLKTMQGLGKGGYHQPLLSRLASSGAGAASEVIPQLGKAKRDLRALERDAEGKRVMLDTTGRKERAAALAQLSELDEAEFKTTKDVQDAQIKQAEFSLKEGVLVSERELANLSNARAISIHETKLSNDWDMLSAKLEAAENQAERDKLHKSIENNADRQVQLAISKEKAENILAAAKAKTVGKGVKTSMYLDSLDKSLRLKFGYTVGPGGVLIRTGAALQEHQQDYITEVINSRMAKLPALAEVYIKQGDHPDTAVSKATAYIQSQFAKDVKAGKVTLPAKKKT